MGQLAKPIRSTQENLNRAESRWRSVYQVQIRFANQSGPSIQSKVLDLHLAPWDAQLGTVVGHAQSPGDLSMLVRSLEFVHPNRTLL